MTKTVHGNRRGWLKNGKTPGDFRNAPPLRSAHAARDLLPRPRDEERALQVSRWEKHGPRTPEGIERIRRAVTKHGLYSKAAKAQRRHARLVRRALAQLLDQIADEFPK